MIMPRYSYRPVLVRAALVVGWLLLASSQAARAEAGTILVLGDSISAAYGMSLQQGWVTALDEELGDDYRVVNASISGETTAGGLRRLPALLAQHKPALVIIELGGNDGLRGYPLQKFRRNLNELVMKSLDAGARAILVPMEIPPNYGTRYTDGFRQAYRDVAEETGVALSPFILDGVATNPELMQEDGIHPTTGAQALLLANMLPTVREVLKAP